MPLTSDAPPTDATGGPGDTASTAPPPVPQPPDDVVQKVKGLLGQGHSVDELKQSKLYAQYGDPLITAATAQPEHGIKDVLSGLANWAGGGAVQLAHGATKAITNIPSSVAGIPDQMMKTGMIPGINVTNAADIESIPIIHKYIGKLHDALDPISESLANVVNPAFPTMEQLHQEIDPENKHPELLDGYLKGMDVAGNLVGGMMLGDLGSAIGGKMMEMNKPTALGVATKLDKARAFLRPARNAAYDDAYQYSINPNISAPIKELVEDPAFPKAVDKVIETFGDKVPWMKELKQFRSSISTPAAAANPTAAQMTGGYIPPVPVSDIKQPMSNIPVAAVDGIKRYLQRGIIGKEVSETGLNLEEANRLKNVLDGPSNPQTGIRSGGALDAVDAQVPDGKFALARELGKSDIQMRETADFMYNRMSSADQGARDVARGMLDAHVNDVSNKLEAGEGGALTVPFKAGLTALRYGARGGVKPVGVMANAVINAATNPKSDAMVIAEANRFAGNKANFDGATAAPKVIEKAYMDAASQSNGDALAALMKYIPLSTLIPTLKQMHPDATQTQQPQQ